MWDPTKWTILQQDGPNHLGLWYNALPEHQIALITSGCAPVRPANFTDSVLLAVGETGILLYPPLPLAGVSIGMEKGCQQTDRTLADG